MVSEEELKNMSPEQIAELQAQNCIFCKIIKGEIPSKKIYEDEHFLGVLDISPANEGHVLIMPKQHVQVMPQMTPVLVGKLGLACKNVSHKLIKVLGVEGTSIFVANGAVAGQKAPHFMVHVIPRKKNDGVNLNPSQVNVSEKDLLIKANLMLKNLGLPLAEAGVKHDKVKSEEYVVEKSSSELEDQLSFGSDESSESNNKKVVKDSTKKSAVVSKEVEVDLDEISKLFE